MVEPLEACISGSSKEDAEKLYTTEWKNFVKETYGSEPAIAYFYSPVVVDNLSQEIIKE